VINLGRVRDRGYRMHLICRDPPEVDSVLLGDADRPPRVRTDERFVKTLALGWHHHGIPHVLVLSREDRRLRASQPELPGYVESGSVKATKVQHRRHPYEFVA
jgi:hypothetical protein